MTPAIGVPPPRRTHAPRALHLLCPANLLFDPLRQNLIFRRNFLHRQSSIRVQHRVGLRQKFFGTCSPPLDEHLNLRIRDKLACRHCIPHVEQIRAKVARNRFHCPFLVKFFSVASDRGLGAATSLSGGHRSVASTGLLPDLCSRGLRASRPRRPSTVPRRRIFIGGS